MLLEPAVPNPFRSCLFREIERLCYGLLPLAVLAALLVAAAPAAAKDIPVSAIILYRNSSGVSYLQITDFMLNGKQELRDCSGADSLDKNAFRHLPKFKLSAGMVLERTDKGNIKISGSEQHACVLPSNMRMEAKSPIPISEAADGATLEGQVVGNSSNATQSLPSAFPKSTIVYLMAKTETEQAEFLRAGLANTITIWRDYVSRYPQSPHSTEAKRSLADLVSKAGAEELAAFQKSVAQQSPDFGRLQNARVQAREAERLVVGFIDAGKLRFAVEHELQNELAAARNEFMAYLTAVNGHTAGYSHLAAAQSRLANVTKVDAEFSGADKLQKDIVAQKQALEKSIASATDLVTAKRFDEAYGEIARYRQFEDELPQIAAVIQADFVSHRDRGMQMANDSRWEEAISDFRHALELKKDEATAAELKKAEAALQSIKDARAAEQAVAESNALAAAKKYIEAFQKLDDLEPAQRSLVTAQMDALKPQYLKDLIERSANLSRVHIPIRGRADEDGVLEAHDYLSRAVEIDGQDAFKIKLDLIADRLCDYYLDEAKHALEKPRGSGVGLGWLYLQQAQRFKPNRDDVRDQITRYAPEYENRAKLSISILFRDQTSRRDSLGFADQMADTIASGLENSGLPGIRVVSRRDRMLTDASTDASAGTHANFQLVGNIIQHRVDKKMDTERLTSRYRSGQREVKNPAWLSEKRKLDDLQRQYDLASESLRLRATNLKKKEVVVETANLETQAKALAEEHKKLDAIPEMILEDVILPYNYTRRNYQVDAVVEVEFRVYGSDNEASGQAEKIRVEIPKTVSVLENVKPEDVDGVVEAQVPPDEFQLLSEADLSAQKMMVNKIIERMSSVPGMILAEARDAATRSDLDGAAAEYVLYLNSTPPKQTAERTEALQFLEKNFNLAPAEDKTP